MSMLDTIQGKKYDLPFSDYVLRVSRHSMSKLIPERQRKSWELQHKTRKLLPLCQEYHATTGPAPECLGDCRRLSCAVGRLVVWSACRLVGLLAGLGLAHVRCRWCPRLANLAEGTHCQCILRLVGLSAEGRLISIATTHFVSPDQAQD